MKKNTPRKKINIKRETRKEIKGNPSRKIFTQEKKVLHLMRMTKATVTQK
jgi:hypothetical protein